LKEKVKQLFLNDLVKISSGTGVAAFIKIAAQFITSKVLAIFVGPAGIAIMGQLSNVSNIVQSIGSGGINVGVTKYVSEYSSDRQQLARIINSALKITFICSAICSVVLVFTFRFIGQYVFRTNNYNSVIFVLGITLILFSFNNLFISIINGLRSFRLYVIVNIISSITSLLITLVFVKWLGVYGALLAFVLAPALLFCITYSIAAKQYWLDYSFLRFKLDFGILKMLGRFSLMAINNAIVGSVAQIVIRSLITKKLSIETAGIWDGMNRISGAYLLLLTTSIQVYYLPTLSAIKDSKLLWREIIKSEKIVLPLVSIMFLSLYLLRGWVIQVLFTPEFYLMKDIFLFQIIGDLIKVASWVISYTMYAKAMTKQLIITDNLFTIFYISLIYLFIDKVGLTAIYYGYIINQVVYLVFIYFLLRKKILGSYI
jgi:O-antigen/teichoic acid export membrane protein